MTTTDMPIKPQGSRDMSVYSTFRQVSSQMPALQHERITLSSGYIGQEKTNNLWTQIYQFDQDSRNLKTNIQPQLPILARDNLDYIVRENQVYNTTQTQR